MQAASGTLSHLHRLTPRVKALLAGVLGLGYLAALYGLLGTAFSAFLPLGAAGNPIPLLVGLLIFYLSCVGLGILNTDFPRAAKVAFVGMISSGIAWPLVGPFLISFANSVYRSDCLACEFFSDFLVILGIFLPGLVPAIVILTLSMTMNQGRWRGVGIGLLGSLILASALAVLLAYWSIEQTSPTGPGVPFEAGVAMLLIGTPLAWSMITHGTLRARDMPLDLGHL